MIKVELIEGRNDGRIYYVSRLNEEGLIVATLLVYGEEGITAEYLLEQAKNPNSDIYKELDILEQGKPIEDVDDEHEQDEIIDDETNETQENEEQELEEEIVEEGG